ncbi:hypothetical protein, partial [Methanoregula sp.]
VTPPTPANAYPSYPTPTQGESLCNCPLIAGLASIAWVNRQFILHNIAPAGIAGNYSVTFWDYPAAAYPPPVPVPGQGAGCQLNGLLGAAVAVPVTVSGTIPLLNASPVDPATGMTCGAGSSNVNEIWPALYEKAYAKFMMYKAQIPSHEKLNAAGNPSPLQIGDLANPAMDPNFGEVQNLTQVQWGGNAGVGLLYLTGLPCYAYNLNSAAFTPTGHINVATPSVFTFIRNGFCRNTAVAPYGLNKTLYPLVAWTYLDGTQPAGVAYNNGIIAGHCYAILGIMTVGASNYIILRTTYGTGGIAVAAPNPNPLNLQPLVVAPAMTCYDALFTIGALAPFYPPTLLPHPNNIPINLTNGIFGIEASISCTNNLTTFQNYFSTIGWAD